MLSFIDAIWKTTKPFETIYSHPKRTNSFLRFSSLTSKKKTINIQVQYTKKKRKT